MSQARTCDLLQYYQYQVQRQETSRLAEQSLYDIYAADYEAQFFPKLFGWKYKNTSAGNVDPWRGHWGGLVVDPFYAHMILQCTYTLEIGLTIMDVPPRSSRAFFDWMAENMPSS